MSVDFLLKYAPRIIILFICQPVHEWAHAWSAYKLGDDTAAYMGRKTLNPIAHLDPVGTLGILFCGFGWGKPVPVNPAKFDRKHTMRKGMAITAAAGPLSNLVMALLATILYKFIGGAYVASAVPSGTPNETLGWLTTIAYYIVVLNIGLGVFNLIPVQPLDGSKIFAYFAGDRLNAKLSNYQQIITFVVLGLLIFSDFLNKPMALLNRGFFIIMNLLTFWVDPIVKAVFHIQALPLF